MTTNIEILWIFALVSKCKSLTSINTLCFLSLFVLTWLIIKLVFWFHPGGPAWGKHKWTNNKLSTLTITKQHKKNTIPGPKGVLIIGSMSLMSGLAHQKVSAMAETLKAKRLMAISVGETRLIVTCNPDVAKEILNNKSFTNRPVKESAYSLMFNKAIGFAPYGTYWRTLRKISATHLFCPKQIQASEPQRLDISSQMVAELSMQRNKVGGPVRVREILKSASLYNIMSSVFGKKYKMGDFSSDELRKMVDEGYDLLGTMNWSDHLPFLGDLDLQRIKFRCFNLVPRVNKFVGEIIAEHRAQRNENISPQDFVDVMLSLQETSKLSDCDIIAVLWEMIFRGTDTIAVLMEWILARLVLHPQVQKRVHEELDKVVGRTRGVTESDLTEMVYLTAMIKEVLRLHPPGPLLSWARLAVTNTLIDGYDVPKGTTAMVNMWGIMRDPQVWVNPLEFNPDRFLNNGDNIVDISIWGSDSRIAPFGSGRRVCPGKNLAMTTVTFWVASMLHEFEFGCWGETGVDLSEKLKLSCEMANPLMVKVCPRKNLP
ncbi:hypothetical protein Leryth_016757 [Lithospermum erythrorhizon]|nr:hypothetical protein Leryth_016757 [Lithospermum erythrorhizon]